MQLGFVSAILPDLSFDDTLKFAAHTGFDCVEIMCWPPGKADRRYAGVTHLDVTSFDKVQAARILERTAELRVDISGLGYYPNALSHDTQEAAVAVEHLRKVIIAAPLLGLTRVNTFIGRDWKLSVVDNWPSFLETWRPLIKLAEDNGVKVGIENCPMTFTADEWPGGKNLASTPAVWRRMFNDIPSESFGLNYDPSHMVWQFMDYLAPMREFRDKLFHIHAKDVRVDKHKLDQVGTLAHPNEYHTPKLPGMGDVDWGRFFSVLTDVGYRGPVCVEVEDRAYEGTLERRQAALRQSHTYLRNFVPTDA